MTSESAAMTSHRWTTSTKLKRACQRWTSSTNKWTLSNRHPTRWVQLDRPTDALPPKVLHTGSTLHLHMQLGMQKRKTMHNGACTCPKLAAATSTCCCTCGCQEGRPGVLKPCTDGTCPDCRCANNTSTCTCTCGCQDGLTIPHHAHPVTVRARGPAGASTNRQCCVQERGRRAIRSVHSCRRGLKSVTHYWHTAIADLQRAKQRASRQPIAPSCH